MWITIGRVQKDLMDILWPIPWADRNEYYHSERDRATAAISCKELQVDVQHPAMPIVDAVNRSTSKKVRSRVRRERGQVAAD